ncbi:MAG: RpiB/LacA/LacB family sugar-phosphate isomerase [bacterium]
MKLVLAADHGGAELKDSLVSLLKDAGYEVEDIGTHGTESVDYPDYAFRAASLVADGIFDGGILLCGTGIGMSIAANKVKGIRCAKINSEEEGRLAAEHNFANMVALGGRTTSLDTAWAAVHAWLIATRGGERHERRVGKINDVDNERG